MAKYRLTQGKHHTKPEKGGKLKTARAGDVIELDDDQAEAFADRIEPVGVATAKPAVTQTQATAQASADKSSS